MRSATVFITGGSGLIGSHLCRLLLRQGARVVSLARKHPFQEALNGCVKIDGDIRDRSTLESIFSRYQPSHMVHLAAQPIVGNALSDADSTFDINIKGTWLLLEAARKYNKLRSIVVASSDKAYGQHGEQPYREDFVLNARFPYDISKKATEELSLSYYHTYNLPISITRCGNTFGAYDLNFSRIVPGTIRSCLNDENIIIRSSGELRRCYVYAEDVADAYLKLLIADQDKVIGEAFNIGNSTAISVLEMVKKIKDLIPESRSSLIIENKNFGEIEHQSLDCNKISSLLDWKPSTTLEKALKETINWYQAQGIAGINNDDE